eukprot:scaffold3748_cov94-Isochrysis_galbana.AAC.2
MYDLFLIVHSFPRKKKLPPNFERLDQVARSPHTTGNDWGVNGPFPLGATGVAALGAPLAGDVVVNDQTLAHAPALHLVLTPAARCTLHAAPPRSARGGRGCAEAKGGRDGAAGAYISGEGGPIPDASGPANDVGGPQRPATPTHPGLGEGAPPGDEA